MKTKISFICLLIIAFNFCLKAQFVTIPDANFVTWLQTYYPTCMTGNQMDTTCAGIQNATNLNLAFQSITDLTGVKYFSHLQSLYCFNNLLTTLPTLPDSLIEIQCQRNYITNLSILPNSLIYLHCEDNLITNLPILPDSLEELNCGNNLITTLPTLPDSLKTLVCYGNQITGLPTLPNMLQTLCCSINPLPNLPFLPNSINNLQCEQNLLTSLPTLPNNLQVLRCGQNQLTTLPPLPNILRSLFCNNNQINNLLTLPDSLEYLICNNNNITCFPIFPNRFTDSFMLNISANPFTCLPNYVSAMNSLTLSYPLCINGDIVNNPNGCNSANGIIGSAFKDNNSNCSMDIGDIGLSNISLKLYDSSSNLIAQTYSALNGIYNFPDTTGTYLVKIDTVGMPYTIQCVNPGIDSTVILTSVIPLVNNVNFDIVCKQGFDVGVQSIYRSGLVFPGLQHRIKVVAGSLSNWYNLNCAAGISGTVQITVSGPVVFDSIASGALLPSITGNVFTYNISDFGIVNILQDFGLLFTTDTSAQIGDQICVNVIITPSIGDINPSNNTYNFCYFVSNSFDPNMKEVYPTDVLLGFQDYFTYTIHFQNTGNSPAINIRLVDTLNSNLDLETFQLINYSHYNIVSLTGNVLTFRFPNIQLLDSSSNLEGSKGFVQYRVKPKANLALGTQIENTANIYFDYNSPVVTNTTINEYVQLSSINENEINIIKIYPNPFNSFATIQFNNKVDNAELIIFDLLGQKLKVINHISGDKVVINRDNFSNGIYFIRLIQDNKLISTSKLIITD